MKYCSIYPLQGPSRHSNSADSIAVAFGLDQSIEYVAWSAKEDNLDAFGLEDKARGRKDETVEKYGNDKPDINKSDENEQGQVNNHYVGSNIHVQCISSYFTNS